jgi:hypothetical protein
VAAVAKSALRELAEHGNENIRSLATIGLKALEASE